MQQVGSFGGRLPVYGRRRALGLDMSLPFRHGWCMPGAMRGRILPPREGGHIRLSGSHMLIACHGEAASPGVGRAVRPKLPEVSYICLLIVLQLATLVGM